MTTHGSNGFLQPPLEARNGRTLGVLAACRVSDPDKQDERSPQEQAAMLQEWLAARTNLPFEVTALAGSGSGECLEREEYLQLIELIESERYDLVITEDLGRIVRRIHAHLICELCVDHNVRLISLNDHVDTAQDGWEDRSIFSAWHHERSNRDTSDRIKRTHRARFRQGGCLSLPIYGYRKKPGAKTDEDIEKLPEAEPIYSEWFRRLDEENASYSEIADWLNAEHVPTGPYCRNAKWDCRMVARTTHNWLLKGVRYRNKRKSRRDNRSGRYKSEKAKPEDLVLRPVAHLAFFDEAYYDRVVATADLRNAKYRRRGENGQDARRSVPKKRTRWPGQHICCGVCGRVFVYGGHGQKDHLMCSGARQYNCWNAITVDGPSAARKMSTAICAAISSLPDFEPTLLSMAREEAERFDSSRENRLREIDRDREKVGRQIANIVGALREAAGSPSLMAELQRLEAEKADLLSQRDRVERTPRRTIKIPSIEEVRLLARESFEGLAVESPEFARAMHKLIPQILVYPYRLIDGGHIVLRARFPVSLAHLVPGGSHLECVSESLSRSLQVDLFDPPQREEYREQVVSLRASGATQREIAAELGITQPAVERAAAFHRLMEQQNLTDPYVPVTEPPSDYGRLRRHLHPRYHFEPLAGHDRERL